MTTDKHGQEINKGDTVELFYGGDRHEAPVDKITEEHGIDHVHASITTHVPAGAVRVTKKAEKARHTEHKKDEPKDEKPAEPKKEEAKPEPKDEPKKADAKPATSPSHTSPKGHK